MLSQDRLIDLIRELNPSSKREWLSQFKSEKLRQYLDHLEYMQEPRSRRSHWTRPGDTPAIVWLKAG